MGIETTYVWFLKKDIQLSDENIKRIFWGLGLISL